MSQVPAARTKTLSRADQIPCLSPRGGTMVPEPRKPKHNDSPQWQIVRSKLASAIASMRNAKDIARAYVSEPDNTNRITLCLISKTVDAYRLIEDQIRGIEMELASSGQILLRSSVLPPSVADDLLDSKIAPSKRELLKLEPPAAQSARRTGGPSGGR